MRTLGLIHRLETNGAVTSTSVEADSASPALEVFRSVFGQTLTLKDLREGNRFDEHSLETITWGRWQTLNPITVIGATMLRTSDPKPTSELASVTVLAGPDSGFTIAVDPRRPRLSRLPHEESLTIIDPCISRSPVPLSLDAAGGREATCLGATVFAPAPGPHRITAERPTAASAPQIRSPPFSRGEDTHIAPNTVDDPRPARPPQWWTFLIPVGIGVVLAVATGMWWFLLFSASAPLSGYLAYLMEKKRFARDSEQCLRDRAAALTEARARLRTAEAAHRATAFSSSGLCLGFGTIFSNLTIDEQLQEATDHVDGRIVSEQMPIRIDPVTTAVTVSGDIETLRTMAFAWLNDHRYAWRPGPELAQLPELAGTEFAAERTIAAASNPKQRAPNADDVIDVHLDDSAGTGILTLSGPRPTSAISIALGTLAQARTTSSTAPGGPVPGRLLTATLMPASRFVTLHGQTATGEDPQPWPSHGLGELCDDAPDAVIVRWRHPTRGPVIIGRGSSGAVGIDLFADGPHALVAGTTGSGKSLLLQTWLLSMALAQPPRRLRFVLIDFKGGATFAPLQTLPHTDSVLDDFDSGLAFRALVSIRAEITRRERLLADFGCADVLDLADPPPRLVVVIDEFHALMATHPRAADLLEHLTALGRSLGVHLILATQRPMGVVTGQMKANINIRVCLRVRDATDSLDVIGTEDGALLPADRPGAACLDAGISLARFRVAVPFGTDSLAEAALRPRARPWRAGPVPTLPGGVTGVSVDNIIAAADAVEEQSPSPQIVLPPLPGPDETKTGAHGDEITGGATGLIDIPTEQRQQVWTYDPEVDGSTILIGGEPEITDSVLACMARAAAPRRRIIALGRIASSLDWADIRCGMSTGWQMQSVLDHLTSPQADAAAPPSLLVCGNWAELVDSLDYHWADQLERLFGHGASSGLVFLLSGCRNATSRSSRFATQLFFPPEAGEDGTSHGLSRQRFAGTWPQFRAVVRGAGVSSTGAEGADVQLWPEDVFSGVASDVSRPRSGFEPRRGCEPGLGFEPRWHGLDRAVEAPADEHVRAAAAAGLAESRIPIGVDAFGELVFWDPLREGSVLTVRGSPQSGKTEFAALMKGLSSAAASTATSDSAVAGATTSAAATTLAVHDDAHREDEPVDWDLLDGRLHVLTVPTRFSAGYGSPLSKAQNLGPLLVLGVHTRQDLTGLGLLRQAPLDGLPGTGWFATEARARPVRLFRAEEGRELFESRELLRDRVERGTVDHDQLRSAGGPVRVS
jgi:S-DNA-T family DNA segregation ATPase FtsK/SpoIIIE